MVWNHSLLCMEWLELCVWTHSHQNHLSVWRQWVWRYFPSWLDSEMATLDRFSGAQNLPCDWTPPSSHHRFQVWMQRGVNEDNRGCEMSGGVERSCDSADEVIISWADRQHFSSASPPFQYCHQGNLVVWIKNHGITLSHSMLPSQLHSLNHFAQTWWSGCWTGEVLSLFNSQPHQQMATVPSDDEGVHLQWMHLYHLLLWGCSTREYCIWDHAWSTMVMCGQSTKVTDTEKEGVKQPNVLLCCK